MSQKHTKMEEIGYAGKCRDRELCGMQRIWKISKYIPCHIFSDFPLLENSMRRVHTCKTEGVLYWTTNCIHLSFPHILTSWQKHTRLLFLQRLIPPAYSIWGVSTYLLVFTFSPTNFVRDRDLIPSQNEWENKTASADLVPSHFNFQEKTSQGQGKKNKFSKRKKCKLAGVLQAIGERKERWIGSANPWLKQRGKFYMRTRSVVWNRKVRRCFANKWGKEDEINNHYSWESCIGKEIIGQY